MSVELREVAPQLCTVREAASRLGISATTMRKWIHAGRVRCLREGRIMRVYVSWVADVLAAARVPQGRRIGRGAR